MMEPGRNTVAILSTEPFVAEVSDCLMCGARVPDRTPWYESGSESATAHYRLCRSCLTASLYEIFMGGAARGRFDALLAARLTAVHAEFERCSALLSATPTHNPH